MNREGSSNNKNADSDSNSMNDLVATLRGTAIGPDGMVHSPPPRVRKLYRHSSRKNSTRPTKFKLAKPSFIHKVYVPTEHRRFPHSSLLNTKYKTARMRALNQRRRGVILGLKKQTRRPQQKSTRKSTRRKTVK